MSIAINSISVKVANNYSLKKVYGIKRSSRAFINSRVEILQGKRFQPAVTLSISTNYFYIVIIIEISIIYSNGKFVFKKCITTLIDD